MNWYKTILAEEKVSFDIGKTMKGLFQGMGLAVPFSVAVIVNSTGMMPEDAKNLINTNPQEAQRIIEQAPPEIVQQAQLQTSTVQKNENNAQNQPPYKNSELVTIDQVAPFIAQWEGKSPYAYADGNSKSVGYGFYLGNPQSRTDIENVGANFDDIFHGRKPLNDRQMQQLLKLSSQRAIDDAISAVNDLHSHPEEVQIIIIDMAYNLGGPRLRTFTRMLDALNKKDYKRVAKEMEDSRWFGQVGMRSQHHADKIKSFSQ